MCLMKTGVRSPVSRGSDPARGSLRTHHAALTLERLADFRPDLEINFAVEIKCNVSSRPLELIRANVIPDLTASRGNDPGQLVLTCAKANDSRQLWLNLRHNHLVCHRA